MKPLLNYVAILVAASAFSAAPALSTSGNGHWPQWRGPLGTGESPDGRPPIVWSEEENVAWKLPLPGLGQSTPVIWGDTIYLTTAVPVGTALAYEDDHDPGAHDNMPPDHRQDFVVLAVNRGTGKISWQRTLRSEQPHEGTHTTASWASQSPVTDGERLIVSFGSRGIFGLDTKGKVLWEKDLGDMRVRHGHGEGSSPALYGNHVVVNWDHEGDSFVVALDQRNGKELWRAARDEMTSWSSPLIVEHEGKVQVILAATGRVRSYDLENGKVLWECGGLSRNVVATPLASDGLVYVANSYDWQAMMAIRLDARGDITAQLKSGNGNVVVWQKGRDTPYVPSPVLAGNELCFMKHLQGIMTCVDAKTGESELGARRLPGIRNVFASPVAAAGRLYVSSREGATVVLRQSDDQALAINTLDDSFSASPAIAGDTLYLRGNRSLYALREAGDHD